MDYGSPRGLSAAAKAAIPPDDVDMPEDTCRRYALFMAHLGRRDFDVLYWTLFAVVLALLVVGAASYSQAVAVRSAVSPPAPPARRAAALRRCLWTTLACFAGAVAALALETLALLALQFCDGENLMTLYWATWTMLQAGSAVALGGILLAVCLIAAGQNHPPWALALGAPVLVVAGLGNLVWDVFWKALTGVRRKGKRLVKRPPQREAAVLPTSRPAPAERTWDVELVGRHRDGRWLVEFSEDPKFKGLVGKNAELLYPAGDGRTLFAIRRDPPTAEIEAAAPEPVDQQEEHIRAQSMSGGLPVAGKIPFDSQLLTQLPVGAASSGSRSKSVG